MAERSGGGAEVTGSPEQGIDKSLAPMVLWAKWLMEYRPLTELL
jgi:hypothetical protein